MVALPNLYGQEIDGIPHTRDGFIVVDEQSRVVGFRDIFAAGDVTNFPVKQGGIAAQQADAAAEAIAADLGAIREAAPFRPILRGVLLTGRTPATSGMRPAAGAAGRPRSASSRSGGHRRRSSVATWLRSSRGLPTPGSMSGGSAGRGPRRGRAATRRGGARGARRRALAYAEEQDDGEREDRMVGEIMSNEVLVVAPEDTLGEIAERMRDRRVGSAVVSDFGRLIGILTSRDLPTRSPVELTRARRARGTG